MPQVDGAIIKDRAARLRDAGAAAASRFLADQRGKVAKVLMEGPNMGRTETFAEVRFAQEQPEGSIVETSIVGVDGMVLVGTPNESRVACIHQN
jgi:threonylcarbamoyladenosine tRNA methylthiotransferase MtaB